MLHEPWFNSSLDDPRGSGPDSRFPGVVYQSGEEAKNVQLDLDRAHEEAQRLGLHFVAQGSIALYRTALAAQCFSTLACAKNLWVLTTDTTVTGDRMTPTDMALFGINLAAPLIFHSAVSKLVNLEYFSAAQYAPAGAEADLDAIVAASKAQAAAEEAESLLMIRRSEIVKAEGGVAAADAGEVSNGSVQIGSQRAFFVVPDRPLFRGGRVVIPKHLDPSAPRHYQVTDDGCLLTAFEEARRNAGLPPRTWDQTLDTVFERSLTRDAAGRLRVDLIYKPRSAFYNGAKGRGTGTYVRKFERFMEMDGAQVLKVEPGHRFNVPDLELALSKQRQVLLRVTFPNEDFGHAILLRDIETAANGRKTIRFYDPWHGFDEVADMCEFTAQWDRYDVKIFRFKKK